MIDKDPNKSTRSIIRDIEVSGSLIRKLVHEDIQYFSYKMTKGQFSSQAMNDQTKNRAANLPRTNGKLT